jgi:hypothetical protein
MGWGDFTLANRERKASFRAARLPESGQSLTKAFHVKHFRPVRPENLTTPHTCFGVERSMIACIAGAFGELRMRAAKLSLSRRTRRRPPFRRIGLGA